MQREELRQWPVGGGPLIGMRLWLTRSFWRLGPGWAVLAGALASGALVWRSQDLLRLLLLVFLADPAWGGLWTILAERRHDTLDGDEWWPSTTFALPYLRPGSPAARLLGWAESDRSLVAAWRLGLPTLLATGLVALILGREAVLATLLALSLCMIGWGTARLNGRPNTWVQASLTIGLPWVLGHLIYAPMTLASLGGGAAFTVWQRAALEVENGNQRAWWLLALSQLGVVALLVGTRHPLWAAGVALASAPTWWTYGRIGAEEGNSAVLAHVQSWWWVALLAAGWALGGAPG
ncbi:MAG: hypothetical protein GXP39_01050 [Chloroflexi bacterium]|nr:hypothetical protein [Chloroflexota bacterium]